MRFRADKIRLRALVKATVIRALPSVSALRVSVTVPYIRLKVVTGRFFKRLRPTETLTLQSLTALFLGRGFADNFSVGDFPDVVPNKRPVDTVGAADIREPFAIGKGLVENPKVEDGDYFAEDYTDVGYTIIPFERFVAKPFVEPLTFGDTAVVGLSPAFTESPTVSDAVFSKDIIAATEKVLTADITDVAAATLIRVLGNSAVTGDTRITTAVKVLTDTAQTTDAQLLTTVRGLTDTAQTADAQLLATTKGLTDTAQTTDAPILSSAKGLIDTAAADDTLVAFAVGRTAVDSVPTTELVALSANLGIIDAPSVADSGALRMQDYCDFDYFAEDYVGEVRTF